MNKLIKDQLLKTRIKLPTFDENTTQILIRRTDNNLANSDLEVGHCYSIYIEDYIINEPENFTLSINWNNGTKPQENKLNIKVLQIMGKMIRVYSHGITGGFIWEGWLPRKAITIMEEIHV